MLIQKKIHTTFMFLMHLLIKRDSLVIDTSKIVSDSALTYIKLLALPNAQIKTGQGSCQKGFC